MEQYLSAYKINDFSSLGRVARMYSKKTQRIHHLLSDLQFRTFLLLEWEEKVINIIENYRLVDVELVIDGEILELYKKMKKINELNILTCSFMITVINDKGKQVNIALLVKHERNINRNLTSMRMQILDSYFRAKEIPFQVIKENQICKMSCNNILWIKEGEKINNEQKVFCDEDLIFFYEYLNGANLSLPISTILTEYERKTQICKGYGIILLRISVAQRLIIMDFKKSFNINKSFNSIFILN